MQITTDACDILIHVALDEEHDALLGTLRMQSKSSTILERYPIQRGAIRDNDGRLRNINILVSGEVGDRARELGVLAARKYTPEYVINVGISGIVNGDAKVGDIVLPVEFLNYIHRSKAQDANTEYKDYEIQLGGRLVDADLGLVNHIKDLYKRGDFSLPSLLEYCNNTEILSERQKHEIENLPVDHTSLASPKILSGAVVAGPIVGKSSAFIANQIRKKSPDALAIDMESGILADALRVLEDPAPRFLSIRGISDPGNSNKEIFDKAGNGVFRRWAIANIATVLMAAIKTLPLKRAKSIIHNTDKVGFTDYPEALASQFYTPRYIGQSFSNFDMLSDNESRFPNLFSISDDGKISQVPVSILLQELIKSSNRSSYILRGQSGCGKSALLYLIFRHVNLNIPSHVAFYIDIESILRDTKPQHFIETIDIIRGEISAFLKCHEERRNIIYLLDGCLGYDRESTIVDALQSVEANVKTIFTTGGYKQRYTSERGIDEGESYLGDLAYAGEFELKAISIRSEKDAKALIAGVLASIPAGRTSLKSEEVFEKLRTLGFDYITHYIISLFLENYSKPAFRSLANGSLFIEMAMQSLIQTGDRRAVYSDVCIEALRAHSNSLSETSTSTSASESEAQRIYRSIFSRKPRVIQTTMIARAVITLFSSVSLNEDGLLKSRSINKSSFLQIVFDNDVNSSVKHFMSEPNIERILLKSAQILVEKQLDIDSLSFSLYLLGRITSPRNKSLAQKTLLRVRDLLENGVQISRTPVENADDITQKYERLSLRSLYISLANHNEQQSTDTYIEKLIIDPYEDELNRGFHLEYYGDRRSDDIGVDLQFSDDLGRWNRTSSYLMSHIESCIGGALSPINQIRLVTYLSFIRARHEKGQLNGHDRATALSLIEKLRGACERLDGSAPRYVKMIERNLKHQSFNAVDFVVKMYALKANVRAGWRSRNIAKHDSHIETVASHSFGCAFLAEILLDPDDIYWKSYDIPKVKAFALLHDIGEFSIGDYLPHEKSKVNEAGEIDYISMMGCYSGLRDLSYIRQMFKDYEGQSSSEARLARELDKLDALIQGYIYQHSFPSSEDFSRFMRDNFAHIHNDRLRGLVERLVP